jgi:hemerythrin-like metal-binding protein
MRDSGYGGLEEHISNHRFFLEKIGELQEMGNANQLAVARDLIVFLGDWLLHHILETDKRYSTAQPARSFQQLQTQ